MSAVLQNLAGLVAERQSDYHKLHWRGGFADYLEFVRANPLVAQSAYQRMYHMILSHGVGTVSDGKESLPRFHFFDDPVGEGRDAVFGLERQLTRLVNIFKAGACRYGPERRVLLLHGPVGSAKSTIVRLLKKGLEQYSHTDAGAIYSFSWLTPAGEIPDPMNDDPLKLIPEHARLAFLAEINKGRAESELIHIEGELSPLSRYYFAQAMRETNGDWQAVMERITVRRVLLSEKDRVGIGTFQPKDEKNQDSTELTGDINYRKIAELGAESDPRAFNFDGEFNIANRGMIEFIEVLKLDVAFLYDLLGASQEHKIKPKKFAQTDIDEVIIGHTNEPEYKRLQNNEFMEALRDRTIRIDIPYSTRLADEIRVYQKDFNPGRVRGKFIAPHTIEMAAMWAVLTRLEEPKKAQLTLLQKLKLYNGKTMAGFTEDNVRELREDAMREGMDGISPRYIQDKISNTLVTSDSRCINPFMVLNALEEGLRHHSLIADESRRKHYRELIAGVRDEYADICKNEVQRAIAADEEAITRLCSNYIDNVKAYTQREKVINKYTSQKEDPDERLMRSIEEKIGIPDSRKDDFRREIMNYIGALALEGKTFNYRMNERLLKALELKLFEDQKDSIKLSSLVSSVVDRDTQAKIDVIKERLIRDFGYDEESATDVLNYVASIYARGESKGQ